MKLLFISCFFLLAVSAANAQLTTHQSLKKLGWIEGSFKGMDGNNPFYEIYRILNDSTLLITSYEWNGTDSSKTSNSYMSWRNGAYYLGVNDNFKVTSITDSSIFLVPHFKAYNNILWRKRDASGWDAILVSNKGERLYQMMRVRKGEGILWE